jgi:hypothetical protein
LILPILIGTLLDFSSFIVLSRCVTNDKFDFALFLGVDDVVRTGELKNDLVIDSFETLLVLDCLVKEDCWWVIVSVYGIWS